MPLDYICPECGHESLERNPDHRRCTRAGCDYRVVFGMRCNECLGDLEVVEILGDPYDIANTTVFECVVCGENERAEPKSGVQYP